VFVGPPSFSPQQVQTQTWIVLLAPTAALCGTALAKRTLSGSHTAAFSVGYLILDVAIDYWDVYVHGPMDEKFRDAPIVPFEIGLFGAGVLSTFTALVLLIGLVVGARIRHVRLSSSNWPVSLVCGSFATLGARGLYSVIGMTGLYAPIFWGWTLCFPLVYALALLRRAEKRSDLDLAAV